jgi:hypothetical protein
MRTLLEHLATSHPDTRHVGASDAFVLLTLAFFGAMVLSVMIAAWVLYRRSTRPAPHRQLMIEMAETGEFASQETGQNWERHADWWKHGN